MSASIAKDVDRGLAIVAQLKTLGEELEGIEDRLKAAGLQGEQVDLIDEERDGRQFLAVGSERIVPVVFTADLLTKTFADGSDVHKKIAQAAGDKLAEFFKESRVHKSVIDSGKIFRARAIEILGPKDGPPFISACVQRGRNGIAKSATKIEWNRASEKPAA